MRDHAPTSPQVGRVYARSRNGKAEVVRATALTGEWVECRYLHGPVRAMRTGAGKCKARNFAAAGSSGRSSLASLFTHEQISDSV